jgi:hypothetical protein
MRYALRIAGCALVVTLFALPLFTTAIAQQPGQNYAICYGLAGNPRVNNFSRVFTLDGAPHVRPGEFMQYLHKKYSGYVTQETGCQFFFTEAEAERERQKLMEIGRQHPAWPVVELDWTPSAPARAPAAVAKKPPAPAPAAAPPPAAKPAAPAPAKPAVAASKPGVYVICRSEWNPDLRRFYNPPVDGRGAGYAEWQASYHAYLVSKHAFKGSNFGCGKYPTREAAQKDYDSWVASARAAPSINGQPSPVIITDWKY